MRRLFAAVLLLSCLYAEAQLWACKQAAAQNYDQVLPDGSVIHRRVFIYPQCVAGNLQAHNGPCDFRDIGYIDERRKFHPAKQLTTQQHRVAIRHLTDSGYITP